jgi:hypothetical protein
MTLEQISEKLNELCEELSKFRKNNRISEGDEDSIEYLGRIYEISIKLNELSDPYDSLMGE